MHLTKNTKFNLNNLNFIFLSLFGIFLFFPREIKLNEIEVKNQSLQTHSSYTNQIDTKLPNLPANKSNEFSGNQFATRKPSTIFSTPDQQFSSNFGYRPHYTPLFYRPRIQLDPLPLDLLANVGKQFVGEVVNGMGHVFHRFMSHSNAPQSGINQFMSFNKDNILASASRLVPTATTLLNRSELEKKNNTDIENPVDHLTSSSGIDAINYEIERQKLRQNIVTNVGHLQTMLNTALEVSNQRRDIILRKILENTSVRLDQAREKANQILTEPSSAQIAVRTLYAINQGINGIHSFLHGLLDRINVTLKVKLSDPTSNPINETKKNLLNTTEAPLVEKSEFNQKK